MVIHSVVEVFDLALVAFQEESGSVAEGLFGDGDLVFHIAYIAFWFDFRQGLFGFAHILFVGFILLRLGFCHDVVEALGRGFVAFCDSVESADGFV
jgi:hypothetical protein